MEIIIRDLRKKDQYKIDDAYLNGYARLCGVYATAVYNSLSRHADFHTQECFPSMDKIADQHGISKPSVIKGVAELVKWGIVSVQKGKDPVTKRQLSNVYVLVDKSQWKPKPDSRVNNVYSESRVNDSADPGQYHDKSRVSQIDCKDTQIKDTQIRIATQSVAESSKVKFTTLGADILKAFEEVDPKNKTYYANTTQRKACDFLLGEYGLEEILKRITILPRTNKIPYFPTITTPHDLKEKWVKLQDAVDKKRRESKNLEEKYPVI